MGGPGAERDVSLRSGAAVCNALAAPGARVTPVDVINRTVKLPPDTDLVFNLIHGTFGEDGELQSLLDERGITYTGEGPAGSRLAFDKIESKRRFDAAGVPNAAWEILSEGQSPSLSLPLVAKPPREGSSVGVHLIHKASEIEPALADCFRRSPDVLVEAFISGRELTVGILGDRALPIIEIVPDDGFYDYKHKYTKGVSNYYCPADLPADVTNAVQAVALAAHRALGLEVYSRVDVLLDERHAPYVLEVNTIPGMTETSLLPKAAVAVGISFCALCEEIVRLSLAKRKPMK
jgi:D-alanine-D-alanine ligase